MDDSTLLTGMYTCSKCNKPFNNKSSHYRHVRYCGSRTRQRQRSCQACAAAKAKCSFGVPCSRCLRKEVECIYSDLISVRTQVVRASTAAANIAVEMLDTHSHRLLTQAITDGGRDSLSGLDPDHMQRIDQRTEQYTSIGSQNSQLLGLVDDDIFDQQMTMIATPPAVTETQNWQPPAWCKWAQRGISLAAVSGHQSVVPQSAAIVQSGQSAAQQNAELIVQSLRAFPTMMLRKETWPWFIHPHSHLLLESTSAQPNALSACMGIAQMYMMGTVETRSFVWQTVSTEYHRFAKAMHAMSKLELLSAIQACMIYLIMCIIEGSSQNDTLGFELLQVSGDLYAFYKNAHGGKTCQAELTDPSPDWASWIAAESQRRLATLWLLVGCVVCVRTNSTRDQSQSYRDLPLPGPKLLWEASSESAWKVEYEASRILQVGGLVYLGDLIDAQNSSCTSAGARKLDLWNASVDNIGLLLNLVHNMA